MVSSGDNLKLPRRGLISLKMYKISRVIDAEGLSYQPAPTASLDSCSLGVEFLFECIDGTKVAFNSGLERSSFEFAAFGAGWGQVLPKERVIDVTCGIHEDIDTSEGTARTSAIEFESSLESDRFLYRGSLCVRLLRRVKTVDIGLMVLLVMQSHDFFANVGLQRLN